MSVLASAPVLIPLATAGLTTLAVAHARWQRAFSGAGALAFLGCALWLVALAASGQPAGVVFGGWPAPFGIEFRLDRLSSMLVLVTTLMGAAALLFLASDVDPGPRHPLLLPLLHGTLAGVAGAFCTADLFNLYVGFEVMLICALGLIAVGNRADQLDATFKYLVPNLFGTLLLLAAIGAIFAATGQLNFDALALASPGLDRALLTVLLVTLGLALLLKSAAFPLHFWLRASYPSLPAPVLALVAGLLTKVGVYALLRLLGDVFAPVERVLFDALGWVAVATMVAGVLGAAYHWDMRRILAFHIVSQIGYILLAIAIALGSAAGNATALFYTVHHIVVKGNLFLIAALACALTGSYDLRRIGGLAAARPALALLFAVPALSLVGIPPLSGFWAKLLLLQETLGQGRYVWAAAALGVSLLTLYSMMKIWIEAFWKPHPDPDWRPVATRSAPAWAATVLLATVTLAIGLTPQWLIAYSRAAATALGLR